MSRRLPLILTVLGAIACSGGSGASGTPWEADTATVLGPDTTATATSTQTDEGCVPLQGGDCVDVEAECGEGASADVVVDIDGNAVNIVCFPKEIDVAEPAEIVDGMVAQMENNTAIVVGDGTLDGDLAIDANNVILWGDDPALSIVEGDLELTGNNAIVRGVTITGDVEVPLNNGEFVYCRIEGDVLITGNNVTISGCELFGNVTVEGNNIVLSGNRIAEGAVVSGQNPECKGNVSFDDENGDMIITEDEIGDPFECGDKGDGKPESD